MSTFVLAVIAVAVAGAVTYILMKKGTIADANNNNIPDAIEEKVEEVKVVVKKAKAKVEKAKEVVAEVKKVADKVTKPATKKVTTKATKK
jgi:methyltransferase-like protein